jgi:hypothetical protein
MEDKWQEMREVEAQRSDLIIKLDKIDQKKDTVSHEVYEKVKKEYKEKLEKVNQQMTEYSDLIKEDLINVKNEEKTILEEEKKVKLNIEETELRYTIGEYDEESYKKFNEEYKNKFDEVKEKLDKLHERKNWLEDFVRVKDIEETMEPKEPESGIKIEEHILEEKLPEEETKLDELIVEESVVPEVQEEKPPEEKAEAPPEKKSKEKGVPCPKCGYINAPDSWYCEKCGAEILDSPVS